MKLNTWYVCYYAKEDSLRLLMKTINKNKYQYRYYCWLNPDENKPGCSWDEDDDIKFEADFINLGEW